MTVTKFYNGEMILPQRHPFLGDGSRLCDVPEGFLQIVNKLWIKNEALRFYHGWRECWVFEGGKGNEVLGGYPRMYDVEIDDKISLRRFVANQFFDLDAPGERVYVIMKCGNVDCLNPRHMTFADRPRPNLGL